MGKYFPEADGLVREAEERMGWTAEREAAIAGMLSTASEAAKEYFARCTELRTPAVGRPPLRSDYSLEIPEGFGVVGPLARPRMGMAADEAGNLYAGTGSDGPAVTPRTIAHAVGDWGVAADRADDLLALIVAGMHARLVELAGRSEGR